MIALLLLPLVLSAPFQAPFIPDHPSPPPLAIAPHAKPEVLKAGFSSRGSGIPVLHDFCSGHDLVKVLNTDETSIHVYHASRGFCVSLFAPDAEVAVTVTMPVSQSSLSNPADGGSQDTGGSVSWEEGSGEEEEYEGDSDLRLGVPRNDEGRIDEASWTGRGSMPGSLRLRTTENCVCILTQIGQERSDMEVCLGS